MVTASIFVAMYVGIIVGSFYLFSHFVKKEIGKDSLPGMTWFVTLLAAISVPSFILNVVKFIHLTILLILA